MKLIIKCIAVLTAAVSLLSFSACSENKVNPNIVEDPNDYAALHYYKENGDSVAGVWKITDGTGSKYETFNYIFNGEGKSCLVINNVGFVDNYTIENDILNVTLMFGLNGSYKYKFEGDKLILINTEDNSTSTLERNEDFSCIPAPPDDFSTVDELCGAWKNDLGLYAYFSTDGIFYQNDYGMNFTYSAYSVTGDEITSTYKMKEEITDTYQFSLDKDTLVLNDTTYERITFDELSDGVNVAKKEN